MGNYGAWKRLPDFLLIAYFYRKFLPMPDLPWKGVFPALTTPFDPNEELDLPLFRSQLDVMREAGVQGVILSGTLGEASTLTRVEKESLARTALEHLQGELPVLMNISEGSTREACRAAREAESWGCKGLMVLPPMRYAGDESEVLDFFKAIAGSVNIPIMLYNNPVDYKTLITLDMFDALATVQNIRAVKESTRDVSQVHRMRNAFGDRYAILCGVDTLAFESLNNGADGWVAGLVCAFPRETMALFHLQQAGRLQEALDLYRWFLPVLELDIHPKLVQYIKLAATICGIGSEFVRAPRQILRGAEKVRIETIVRKALADRPRIPFI